MPNVHINPQQQHLSTRNMWYGSWNTESMRKDTLTRWTTAYCALPGIASAHPVSKSQTSSLSVHPLQKNRGVTPVFLQPLSAKIQEIGLHFISNSSFAQSGWTTTIPKDFVWHKLSNFSFMGHDLYYVLLNFTLIGHDLYNVWHCKWQIGGKH